MSASDLLKLKFHSDRQLALYSEAGLKNVIRSAQGVVSNVYSGVQRASWYTSCLTERYADVCQELKTEDYRMLLTVKSLYRYRDVLLLMVELYISMVLDDAKGEESDDQGGMIKNEKGRVRSLATTAMDLSAERAVGLSTRNGIVLGIAALIVNSEVFSQSVTDRIVSKLHIAMFVLQYYGVAQKAAMAARKLKAHEPAYYWLLYELQIEMLYYFIEPAMNKIIEKVKLKGGQHLNQSEMLEIVRGAVNV
ncbi:Uncharacterised protein [Klebsiella pneumoniae]|nr:Uncharacterised protein [Klebsiella pneumoniae]